MKIFKNILVSLIISCLLVPIITLAQGGGAGVPAGSLTSPDSDSGAFNRLQGVVADDDHPTFDADMTDEETLTEYIGLLVNVILSLLGVIFTGLIIWAGYNWMTAGGNEEKVSKAGATIKVAIIGLLIVIGAFAIWRFVFERIVAP